MGVGSRVLRNQILYCGDPSWGPMGPQEIKNRGFGVPGGVWTPISGLPYLSFVTTKAAHRY